jgi:hypothetical protein
VDAATRGYRGGIIEHPNATTLGTKSN